MKKSFYLLPIAAFFVLFTLFLPGNPVAANEYEPPTLDSLSAEQITKSMDHAQVLSTLETGTITRLILKLDVPDFTGTAGLDGAAEAEAMKKIDTTQAQFADKIGYDVTDGMVTFDYIPYVSVWVETVEEYVSLLASPMVLAVQQDIPDGVDAVRLAEEPAPAAMAEAIPWIHVEEAHDGGNDGDGWAIAILDTGVDKDHDFLDDGKVISEACYSTEGSYPSYSLCPGSAASSTAVNSAEPYNTGVCASGECDHGTHVAGIAAGTDSGFTGVAPHANLIAIQVFSYFPSSGQALSWDTDQILGLERVYALRNTYDIASVNMSLGGGAYSSFCASDSRAEIIGMLKGVDIATVIATGNNDYKTYVSAPACISDAIAVGATGDVDDNVTSFSNAAANLVDAWAPGANITSSVPTEIYGAGAPTATWNGTSMATPIIAGAWAVIKEVYPNYTVDQVYHIIDTFGVSVTDQRPGGVAEAPRIDFTNALPATVPTLLTPVGTIGDNTPMYTWTKVDGATQYKLELYQGATKIYALYPKQDLCGATECTKDTWTTLADGDYKWRMQAYVSGSWKSWSAYRYFTVETEIPVPIAPFGGTSDNTPSYTWSKVDGATGYKLEVYQGGTKILTLWPKQKVCGAAECTRTPNTPLPEGDYQWRVLAYVGGGNTAFSAWKTFSVGWTSTFNTDAAGWSAVNGWWRVIAGGGWYRTNGILATNASAVHDNDYSTLTFEVKMMRSGDALAANRLYVMGEPDPLWGENRWYNGYLFQYTNNGSYSVWKYVDGVSMMIEGWTAFDGINADDFNVLTVRAVDGVLSYYINGQKVWEGVDTDLSIGQVGIGMFKNEDGWNPLNVGWARFYPHSFSVTALDETMAQVGESVLDWDNPDIAPER